MNTVQEAAPLIQVRVPARGTLAYEVAIAPGELPPVRARDLAAAWGAARQAAVRGGQGAARLIRFRGGNGPGPVLALQDRDAACWADGVEQVAGLHTCYGMSLCLRLLALTAALAGQEPGSLGPGWLGEDGPAPGLLRAASAATLTEEAGFDAAFLAAPVGPHPTTPARFGATACS